MSQLQITGKSNISDPFSKFKFSMDVQLLLKQKRNSCGYCNKRSHLYWSYSKVSFSIDIEEKTKEKSMDNDGHKRKKQTTDLYVFRLPKGIYTRSMMGRLLLQ